MITSSQNARIKLVQKLQRQSKARRQERQLVLEGVRLVSDAIHTGALPDFLLYDHTAVDAVMDLFPPLDIEAVPWLLVEETLLRSIADTDTPQGLIGVFPWPDLPLPDDPALVVVVDSWRDPGNLGTLLRTAAAAGVELVVLLPGTVDPTNPKVLRAGMGAHWRVPVAALSWDALRDQFSDHAIYLADMHGEQVYDAVDWTDPALLVIGGEAHGVSATARALPHTTLRIPMVNDAESLNAAIAASLMIYAARRHAL